MSSNMMRAATFCRRSLPSLRPSTTSPQPCMSYEHAQSLHVGKGIRLSKTSLLRLLIRHLSGTGVMERADPAGLEEERGMLTKKLMRAQSWARRLAVALP